MFNVIKMQNNNSTLELFHQCHKLQNGEH